MPLSFLMRFFEKVILDSTGLVHLRHPCHAGGFYYCFNAVMTHVACFVAAALYSTHSTGIHIDRASYSATSANYTGANADVRLPAVTLRPAMLARSTVSHYLRQPGRLALCGSSRSPACC